MSTTIDYAFEVHKLLNRKRVKISCIVPAFNEGPRIGKVLDVVTHFPVFDEIILVNDGSSDNTLDIMKYFASYNSKVKVVNISPNKGKTNAVLQGFKMSSGDLICLIDADLEGLKFEYLYKMIAFVLNGDFDMTILDRSGDRMGPLGWSQSWVVRFIGGERAFWRNEFKKVKFGIDSRYAIEQEINLHYIQNKLKVRTIYCEDLRGEYQWNKKGVINALKSYAKMASEIYSHSNSKTFFYQVENIVEDRIEPLYNLMNKSRVKKPVVGAILVAGLISSIATFTWLNIKEGTKKTLHR